MKTAFTFLFKNCGFVAVPFRLANVPIILMNLINGKFHKYLDKFI